VRHWPWSILNNTSSLKRGLYLPGVFQRSVAQGVDLRIGLYQDFRDEFGCGAGLLPPARAAWIHARLLLRIRKRLSRAAIGQEAFCTNHSRTTIFPNRSLWLPYAINGSNISWCVLACVRISCSSGPHGIRSVTIASLRQY
jgi:hypothetical protein